MTLQRDELFELAWHSRFNLPPIYIRSHDRSDKLDTLRRFPFLASRVTLVVAEDEELDYVLAWEGVRITTIPDNYPGKKSAGRAIQFILELAQFRDEEHIIILDDDLMSLSALYQDDDTGAISRAVKSHVPDQEERNLLHQGFFGLITIAAEDAYRREPTAAAAGVQVQSPSWIPENAATMWRLNSGPVFPSQLMSVHVPRFIEKVGQVDPDFHEHGDDLSMTADLLAAGGSTVMLPTFITGWRSYETESTIRNGDTAPAYRQREHDLIMAKPLGEDGYITTKYDVLDRPWWHRINWRKLRKDERVKISERYWKEWVAERELLL